MYTTSDLKKGLIIEVDGAPHVVETTQTSSPTARGGSTIHRVKLRNLLTKQRVDKNFRGGDTFDPSDVELRQIDFLYADAQSLHFMDNESYEQFSLTREDLEWETKFLTEGLQGMRARFYNNSPIGIELPNQVALQIKETNPAVKGNSATGRTKPATLQTGFVAQVPEHISQGTRVTLDTRDGSFMGRATT